MPSILSQRVADCDVGGACEFAELIQVQLEFVVAAPGGDRNQNRAVACFDVSPLDAPGEVVFELSNPRLKVDVDACGMDGFVFVDALVAANGRFEARDIGESGEPVFLGRDAYHGVEAQEQ